MKARNRVEKIRLSTDEHNDLNYIHSRYASDVPLSTFCREILVNDRIHPYNYINADLLDKPVGIEDKGPLRNNMENRYHAKCRLIASIILLLDHKNILTDAIAEDEEHYIELIDYLRGYSFNSENGKKEYQENASTLPRGTKRVKNLTIRMSTEENSRIKSCYGSSPFYSLMPFPEWARKTLFGKIKQSKFSTYYENIYEENKHKFFNEP